MRRSQIVLGSCLLAAAAAVAAFVRSSPSPSIAEPASRGQPADRPARATSRPSVRPLVDDDFHSPSGARPDGGAPFDVMRAFEESHPPLREDDPNLTASRIRRSGEYQVFVSNQLTERRRRLDALVAAGQAASPEAQQLRSEVSLLTSAARAALEDYADAASAAIRR